MRFKTKLADAQTTRPDGLPPKTYRKEILRCGTWVHPVTRQALEFSPEMLEHLRDQFHAMKDAGLKVPVKKDHKPGTENGVGWVRDMQLEGDRLFGVMELNDWAAAQVDQGAIEDVSCSIDDVLDSHAHVWDTVTDEVSLTLAPVIDGMTGFVRLSAEATECDSYIWQSNHGGEGMFGKFKGAGQVPEDEGKPTAASTPKPDVPQVDLAADLAKAQAEAEAVKAMLDAAKAETEKIKADLAAVQAESASNAAKVLVTETTRAKELRSKLSADIKAAIGAHMSPASAAALEALVDLAVPMATPEQTGVDLGTLSLYIEGINSVADAVQALLGSMARGGVPLSRQAGATKPANVTEAEIREWMQKTHPEIKLAKSKE